MPNIREIANLMISDPLYIAPQPEENGYKPLDRISERYGSKTDAVGCSFAFEQANDPKLSTHSPRTWDGVSESAVSLRSYFICKGKCSMDPQDIRNWKGALVVTLYDDTLSGVAGVIGDFTVEKERVVSLEVLYPISGPRTIPITIDRHEDGSIMALDEKGQRLWFCDTSEDPGGVYW